MSAKTGPLLDREKILHLLSSEGPVSSKLKHFEVRTQQKEMLGHLIEAFNKNAIALIEAGTGTGKSIAYLIPALLAATIWNEKVVVSTHTISLQEQLLEKDLPLLMNALGIEIKAVLVKGMSNYVCLRKWDDIEFEKRLLDPEDQETLSHMENLSCHQGVGSRSDFPFAPPFALWDMVSADYETCTGPECPHYQQCYYVQARKNTVDAQLLIVNHHLLLADLVARADADKFSKNALLPSYNRLIIDEAHHLEEIATDYFANKTSRLELLKILSKISYEKLGTDQGKLPIIKEKLLKHNTGDFSRPVSELFNRLTLEIPSLRREVVKEIAETFHMLDQFQKTENRPGSNDENKMRLRGHHYDSKNWTDGISKKLIGLMNVLKRFSRELHRIEESVKEFDDERFSESVKGPIHDLKNLANRLEGEACCLENFATAPATAETIRWLETNLTKAGQNVSCIDAALNISSLLLKYLFNPLDTVALLSATLTTQGSFAYIKDQMGLNLLKNRPLIEASYESPFDFEKQALLIIPKDIPAPTAPDFMDHAEKIIWDAIEASHGNAFILFTSYGMLKQCFDRLSAKLTAARYHPLKQGSETRGMLLNRFISKDRSVLFGTDSFWEGVDVAGEALRLVIIVKLPFKVPTDPLIQARSESLEAKGVSPFKELLLPQAAIKLKQGFGRLIRNKKDRGCILCLDNRLITKSYGQYLLKSLPKCPTLTIESKNLKQEMSDFYKKTYYLTK